MVIFGFELITSDMSIESIIGITSGLIAIGSFVALMWNRFKKLSLAGLLEKLVDTNLTTEKHQSILKKMNRMLPGSKISQDYIDEFVLNNRKKEAVFKDICLKNDIFPTTEICRKFLNADMKKFREEYESKKLNGKDSSSKKVAYPSSTNNEGQTVYMSELLMDRYPETCQNLISILEKHKTNYLFLKGTKDIWCRDYMPVRIESGKLIQFRYEPSYLKGKPEWEESRSDVKEVCRLNGISAQFSDINLDGGNVLICGGRAIVSDRVFPENPDIDRDSLVASLSQLLECEIIIIPTIHGDLTGHADGMVRFVNRDTLLGNNLEAEFKYWREGMQKVLTEYKLSYINVPFFEDKAHSDSAIGVYVNYIEVNNLLVVPVFGREQDKEVIDILHKAFPDKLIETIDYSNVALEGGLLNCTTWIV